MAAPPNLIGDPALLDINDLTRLRTANGIPGFLDYRTYKHYLAFLGHLKEVPVNMRGLIPNNPLNSSLQVVQGDPVSDETDWRADQDLWSLQHMPDIIYEFEPPAYWLRRDQLKHPPKKPYLIHGKTLRDIPILPDHISSKVEGWRVEAWCRMDPRIGFGDIMDRMHPLHRKNGRGNDKKTAMQMRNNRFRRDCNLLGWVTRGSNYETIRNNIQAKLASAGIPTSSNTTRGVSWGLIDVAQGENGGRIEVPDVLRVRQQHSTAIVQSRPGNPRRVPSSLPNVFLATTPSVTNVQGPASPALNSSPVPISNLTSISLQPVPRNSNPAPTPFQLTAPRSDFSATSPELKSVTQPAARPLPRKRRRDMDEYEMPNAKKPRQGTVPEAILKRSREREENLEDDGEEKKRKPIPVAVVGSTSNRKPIGFKAKPQRPGGRYGRPGERIILEPSPSRYAPPSNFPVLQPVPENPARIIVPDGTGTMELKTPEERRNPFACERYYLCQWWPAGSPQRKIQLSYVLDPVRARYGWSDNHGYTRPATDSYPHLSEFLDDRDVHYALTLEEVMEEEMKIPSLSASLLQSVDLVDLAPDHLQAQLDKYFPPDGLDGC